MPEPTRSDAEPELKAATPARPRLLRSTLEVLVGTLASQGSNFLRTFLAARVLGPEVYGIWLGLRLLVDYGAILDLGVLAAMLRQLGVLRGRGDHDGAALTRRTDFTFAAIMGGLGGLGVLGYTVLHVAQSDVRRPVLLGVGCMLFINLVRSYYTCDFRAAHRFRESSLSLVLGSFATLASLPLLWRWGLSGFIAGMIAQALIEICAFAVLSSPPSLGIDGPTLRRDLHFGLPTTAVVLLALSIGSVDRVVILSTLGSETLGYYGLALICVMLVQNLAAVPSMVMTPRLAEAYGRSGRREDLLSMLEVPLDPMARGFAVAVGGLGIALPALVAVFLPKYAPGMTATRIAMVGAFGMVGAGLAASCLGALDRMRVYLVVLATDTAVSYGLARGFVYLVPRLEAVALGWALGALLHMTVMMTSAYVAMGQPVRRGLGRVARLLVPLGYALFCSLLAEWLVARVLLGPIARAVLGEILFLALSLPLLLPLYRALRRR